MRDELSVCTLIISRRKTGKVKAGAVRAIQLCVPSMLAMLHAKTCCDQVLVVCDSKLVVLKYGCVYFCASPSQEVYCNISPLCGRLHTHSDEDVLWTETREKHKHQVGDAL